MTKVSGGRRTGFPPVCEVAGKVCSTIMRRKYTGLECGTVGEVGELVEEVGWDEG